MTSISLQDFERYSSKRAVQASLRRAKISEEGSYEEFVDQLYDDIDQLIYSMQAGREVRQKDSEDRLSAEVLFGLRLHGYEAIADSKTGGHVDLSVKMGEFSWIGEAKKDGNFHEGFLQLTTRYVPASGNFAHNQGGLIFYLIATPDARAKLDTWRDDLTSKSHTCLDCKRNQLAFYSDHKLESSGTNFKVRTMGVALYHKPKDKSARTSAANKTAKQATASKPSRALK
jgi:hypothetical protein